MDSYFPSLSYHPFLLFFTFSTSLLFIRRFFLHWFSFSSLSFLLSSFLFPIFLDVWLALLYPSQSNWFRKSQLTSMVAIGLRKPYAKTKAGKSCTSTVRCLLTWYKVVDNGIKIFFLRVRRRREMKLLMLNMMMMW